MAESPVPDAPAPRFRRLVFPHVSAGPGSRHESSRVQRPSGGGCHVIRNRDRVNQKMERGRPRRRPRRRPGRGCPADAGQRLGYHPHRRGDGPDHRGTESPESEARLRLRNGRGILRPPKGAKTTTTRLIPLHNRFLEATPLHGHWPENGVRLPFDQVDPGAPTSRRPGRRYWVSAQVARTDETSSSNFDQFT